jgi:hypothetical protein
MYTKTETTATSLTHMSETKKKREASCRHNGSWTLWDKFLARLLRDFIRQSHVLRFNPDLVLSANR